MEFPKKEIDSVGLKPGEDLRLENERAVLKNVARLQENANAAYLALYDAPESASSQMRIALRKLEDLNRIDSSLLPILDALKPATIAVDDAF